jgi:hypothetical protein
MDHRIRKEPVAIKLGSLDWTAMGNLVRRQADAAVTLHLASLGNTDNPVPREAGPLTMSPAFKNLNDKSLRKPIRLACPVRSTEMEVRP